MAENNVRSYFLEARVAIIKNEFDNLKSQIEQSPECMNYINASQETLIHFAAYKGTPEMIELLLNAGSDINRTEDGKTPIYYAALKNRIENVKKLIELGAELKSEDSVCSPLFVAIRIY